MKTSSRQLFLGAALACFFTLTLVALAQEEKQTPAPPAATATPAANALPAPDAPATAAAPEEKKDSELRRVDEPPPPPAPGRRHRGPPRIHIDPNGDARIAVGNDVHLAAGERADAVVAIAGSATSEGDVADAVVSIMGSSTVKAGSVGDAVVSVMGNTYVNTKIGGEAVAVMGNVELGPNAEVGGDVVSVGGAVKRDPAAIVHGSVQNVAIASGMLPKFGGGLQTWFRECLLLGRPLAFARGLGWAWGLAIGFFAFYVLLALLFGGAVEKCATTLETRPGGSLLASLLTLLLTPVLIVLLCITIIGCAVVPFLVIALFIAALFGKAVMLAWVGRRFTTFFGPGALSHAAVATLIGAVIVLLVYTVPFAGLIVQKTFDIVGIGVVVYTLMLASKKAKPAAPAVGLSNPPAPAAVSPAVAAAAAPLVPDVAAPPMAFAAAPAVSPSNPAATPAGEGAVPPPVAGAPVAPGAMSFAAPLPAAAGSTPPRVSLAAASLPRAGFWIRIGALLLDVILVGLIYALLPHKLFWHSGPPVIFVLLAAYGAVMWKLKGTTIGGIVCGLKVVRVDDREIDWATAIVRALGCFLSLAVAGLGFIWVAIDDEKQSWHDKIAGTAVVCVPKGVSLL